MAWLDGYVNRLPVTVKSARVTGGNLTDFPVALLITSAAGISAQDITTVFDEVASASSKIAVTTDDGATQLYVEIERWDNVNEEAVLHTKVPSIPSGSDTTLYLYYDADAADNDTYVGSTGTTAAQQVWDSNFQAVYHLSELADGTADEYKDSTSNGNDGEAYGTIPALDETEVNPNQLFVEGDSMRFPMAEPLGAKTVEYRIKTSDPNATLYDTGGAATANNGSYHGIDSGNLRWLFSKGIDGDPRIDITTVDSIDDGVWHYVAFNWDGSTDADKLKINIDNFVSITGTADATETTVQYSPTVNIGHFYFTDTYQSPTYAGNFDELRISDIQRNKVWLDATYYTLNDDFVTFGTEGSSSSSSSSSSISSISSSSSSSSSSSVSSSSSSESSSSSSESSSSSSTKGGIRFFWYKLLDEEGVPISGADVYIYSVNTSSVLNIFDYDLNPVTQPLTTDSKGSFYWGVKDFIKDLILGYEWEHEFRIYWEKGTASGIIEGEHLFGEFTPVELDDTDTKQKRTISNKLMFDWDSHVEKTFKE